MSRTNAPQSFQELPNPVLTLYINTASTNASRHPRASANLKWFKLECARVRATLDTRAAKQFDQQAKLVAKFLAERHPQETAITLFAGVKTWKLQTLATPITNELHWGAPALGQLVQSLNMHKSYGLVVIDHQGVRFFDYAPKHLTLLDKKQFHLDAAQWKKKDLGHFIAERSKQARGPNRDVFEDRVEAQYVRLCHETAHAAATFAKEKHWATTFLVGPARLVDLVRIDFPQPFASHLVLVPETLAKFSEKDLLAHLKPHMQEHEAKEEMALVRELFADERLGVTNPDEVLAHAQNGTLRNLVVASGLDLQLHECTKCGLADRSADPVCAACGGTRHLATLRELLPQWLAGGGFRLDFVKGEAAELLMQTGGLAGAVRQAMAKSAR